MWPKLKAVLPTDTYQRFAAFANVKEQQIPKWAELKAAFEVFQKQRIAIGKLAQSTADPYQNTVDEFDAFLTEQRVSLLLDISKALVEKFKVWRSKRFVKHKFSRKVLASLSTLQSCIGSDGRQAGRKPNKRS